jgi:DNA-binding response OmpR family regulator
MASRRVLVLEDEADLVATYERLLRRHGYRVVSARDRAERGSPGPVGYEPPHLLIAASQVAGRRRSSTSCGRRSAHAHTAAGHRWMSGVASNESRNAALSAGASAVLA